MIEPIFKGEAAVLAATGPSLTEDVVKTVVSHAGKVKLFGLNDSYRMFPFLDVHYACDGRWWDIHYDKMKEKEFCARNGSWTQEEKAANKYPDINRIPGISKPNLSVDQKLIHFGSNSGYQLCNVAYLFGIRTMILVGYNMCRVEGRAHFFGEHPEGLSRSTGYTCFAKHYETIKTKELGLTVINCTPGSALTCFPMRDLQETLDAL